MKILLVPLTTKMLGLRRVFTKVTPTSDQACHSRCFHVYNTYQYLLHDSCLDVCSLCYLFVDVCSLCYLCVDVCTFTMAVSATGEHALEAAHSLKKLCATHMEKKH